jgi:hypothetical protein
VIRLDESQLYNLCFVFKSSVLSHSRIKLMKISVMIEGRIWNTLGIRHPQSDFILNVAIVTMAASDEPSLISGIVTYVQYMYKYL